MRKRPTKSTGPKLPDKSIARLAEYWFRANLMHSLLHGLREEYDNDLDAIYQEGAWWEFSTFLDHWLSGLFVVVEGFNKLKIRDARVQKLFNAHLRDLKSIRHATYHYDTVVENRTKIIGKLNWAEELHEAIGEVVKEKVERKAAVERFLEFRSKIQSQK